MKIKDHHEHHADAQATRGDLAEGRRDRSARADRRDRDRSPFAQLMRRASKQDGEWARPPRGRAPGGLPGVASEDGYRQGRALEARAVCGEAKAEELERGLITQERDTEQRGMRSYHGRLTQRERGQDLRQDLLERERHGERRAPRARAGGDAFGRALEARARRRDAPRGSGRARSSVAEESAGAEAGAGVPAAGEEIGAARQAEGARARPPEMDALVDRLVEALHVGRDARARKVMLLDVQVPGRGGVRVRLRRRGQEVEVRLRADNDELRRELGQRREALRESARQRGVIFASIEVA